MSHFLRFLREANRRELRRLAGLAAWSGLTSACMLALLSNAVGQAAADAGLQWSQAIFFSGAFVLYYFASKLSLKGADALVERLLRNLRVRLTDKIRHSELSVVESLGRGRLFTSVAQTTSHLSQVFPQVVNALQELIVVVFCFLYIANLSLVAFAVLLLVTGLAVHQFYASREIAQEQYERRQEEEAALLDSLGHLVEGFKEVRLNGRKRAALLGRFAELTENLKELSFGIAEAQVALFLLTTTFLYLTLGGMAFLLPEYVDVDVFRLCAALLFCVGPLAGVIGLTPLLWTAEAGLKSLYELEEELSASIAEPRDPGSLSQRLADFQRIVYQDLTFRYPDGSFRSGPWSLALDRGEILFLVGGNGSGKSTVLKLLSGLYQAESGVIGVDGKPLAAMDRAGLRELFSCVFTDYHLFDRLHGSDDVSLERAVSLLKDMGLEDKVRIQDGGFSDLQLSSGQRKRLALVASLLEDKPIYVFDEVAADQDAEFREYFYRRLLPELKKQGKTVICVTHDDRYWDLADRLIKFDLGRIV